MRKTISISIPKEILDKAKEKAVELDIGYQTYIQNILRFHLLNQSIDELSVEKALVSVIRRLVREEISAMLITKDIADKP